MHASHPTLCNIPFLVRQPLSQYNRSRPPVYAVSLRSLRFNIESIQHDANYEGVLLSRESSIPLAHHGDPRDRSVRRNPNTATAAKGPA